MLPDIWLFQEKLKLYFYMKSANLKMFKVAREVPMGFFQPTGCQSVAAVSEAMTGTISGQEGGWLDLLL